MNLIEKIQDWWCEVMFKREKKKLNMIKWGVELYFIESLRQLIIEDLWCYLDELNPDYFKKHLVEFKDQCENACLNIFIAKPGESEDDWWEREIAHIHSEDALIIYKHYNKYMKIYKQRVREQLKKMKVKL